MTAPASRACRSSSTRPCLTMHRSRARRPAPRSKCVRTTRGIERWPDRSGKWWRRNFMVLGEADATYPLQKKGHSLEFLREIAHLRSRARTLPFGAVFRVAQPAGVRRASVFSGKEFFCVHTPIITASDAEGAGDMFRVTTLDLENPPRMEDGKTRGRHKGISSARKPTSPSLASSRERSSPARWATFILLGRRSGRKIPTPRAMPPSSG